MSWKNRGMASAAIVAAVASTSAAAAQNLTISIWGGSYAEEFRESVVAPFEEEHDAEVVLDTGLSSQRLAKLMATRGRGVDLVYLTAHQMAEAKAEGLLQPIDEDALENRDALYDFAKDPLGGNLCPAFTVLGVGLVYNDDHFDSPPKSWTALWDRELPGTSGFPDMSLSYGPPMLIETARLNGGGVDNLDPGLAQVEAMKPDLQIFSRREILESINQGDASIAPHLNIFVSVDESLPLRFAWPKEGGLGVLNLACVVEGTDNAELAQEFIDYHLSSTAQEAMLEAQDETPVRPDVPIPADAPANALTEEALDNLQFFETETILANREEWLRRWQNEILAQ